MTSGIVLGLVVGLCIGLAIGWLGRAQRERAVEREGAAERAVLAAQLAAEQARREELGRAEAERAAEREAERERAAGQFAVLSGKALEENNERFLALAEQRLQRAQESAAGDLTAQKEAIAQLLKPLGETLGRYEESLRSMEAERQQAYVGLTERVTQLATTQEGLERETRNLVTALRDVRTRGRWGEVQLRRVVEAAGMLAHCDFTEQVTVADDRGTGRPDLVVHLPGALAVVVDAKVPLDAYLEVLHAETEDAQRSALAAHAQQVRAHIDDMAKRNYPAKVPGAVDFTVVFVPGDGLLAAAYEGDRRLQEYAVAKGVLLATPTTLIALLRTIAFGWRQEALAENAREVRELGALLFERLSTFGGHLERLGQRLTSAVGAYNDAVGSLESRVLPTARKFPELGATALDATLPTLTAVDVLPRELQAPELVADAAASPALSAVKDEPKADGPAA